VHAGISNRVAKVHGAGDVVIAVGRDTTKTPNLGVTPLLPIAELAIVAVFGRPWHALPHRAVIPFSAGIVVTARGIVIDMNAPLCVVTKIIRAWVVVVAIKHSLSLAHTLLAPALDRAIVIVLAYLTFILWRHFAFARLAVTQVFQTECVSRRVAFHRERAI
jgi:hypothetical protein